MNAVPTRRSSTARDTPPAVNPAADRLAQAVRREMGRSHIPGLSVAVTRHDRLLHAAGYGLADVATGTPATARTAYLWFSMSKIATATAAMMLADEGRLDLDAPIGVYVPSYPAGSVPVAPTVRQLLNHTAGVANPPPIRWVRPAAGPAPDPQELLDRVMRRNARPKYPIGERARYSNLGYLILGQAMSVAAGLPVTEQVTKSLLRPAGMERTGYAWQPEAAAATGYVRAPRLLAPALRAILPAGIVGPRQGHHQSFRPFVVEGAAYGGLVGDVTDAARLAALHLGDGALDGRRLLSVAASQRMRAITTPGKPFDLGLGWFRKPEHRDARPSFVEHLGSGGGYFNAMRIYPDLDLGIVVMANTTRAYDHHAICAAAAAIEWG